MLARLLRLREPAVLVLLAALGLRLLLGLVTPGLVAGGPSGRLTAAGSTLAGSGVDQLAALVLVALVASCWHPVPTAHARVLTIAVSVLLAVGIVVSLVSALLAVASLPGRAAVLVDVLRLLLGLALPALGVAALVTLLAAPRPSAIGAGTAAVSDRKPGHTPPEIPPVAPPATAVPPAPLEPAAGADNLPTWQPEEASGAAWLSAGDAARGAAAAGWGTSADRGGWVPGRLEGSAPQSPNEEQR